MNDYIPNAGRPGCPSGTTSTSPCLTLPPAPGPIPELPTPVISAAFADQGFVLGAWSQHFLAGVTADMMDWWWANMEGLLPLGPRAQALQLGQGPGPGGLSEERPLHLRGHGGQQAGVRRRQGHHSPAGPELVPPSPEPVPRHCGRGVFNRKRSSATAPSTCGEDVPGGSQPPDRLGAEHQVLHAPRLCAGVPQANPTDEERAIHAEYEASRWPVFLPTLYALWQGHPDPSQNVQCDLRVEWTDRVPHYLAENGPVVL